MLRESDFQERARIILHRQISHCSKRVEVKGNRMTPITSKYRATNVAIFRYRVNFQDCGLNQVTS